MPKILKMPKTSSKVEETDNHGSAAAVSKITPMAEIILFPNGRNEVPFSGILDDPEMNTRWLGLADEALNATRKKA